MKTILQILSMSLLLSACQKSNHGAPTDTDFNCQAFKTGISTDNSASVATEVNKLCTDLIPVAATGSDEYGQAQNINILVQRLSSQCNMTATLLCYSCIETLPAQSELKVSFNFNGTSYTRILDITVTPQHMLTFAGMHE